MPPPTLRFAAISPPTVGARLEAILRENRRLSEEQVTAEERLSTLATQFVAVASLHQAVDQTGVVAAVQEVVANLVGSEEFILFDVHSGSGRLTPLASCGVDTAAYSDLRLEDGPIGAAAAGRSFVVSADAVPDRSGLTAAVPLRIDQRVIGVLAIFRLLPHRPPLEDGDRDLLELVGTHAARALLFSRLYERAAPLAEGRRG
jgi:GAF domain-containing protein